MRTLRVVCGSWYDPHTRIAVQASSGGSPIFLPSKARVRWDAEFIAPSCPRDHAAIPAASMVCADGASAAPMHRAAVH